MHPEVVWLAAALLSFPLFALCDPLNVMIAPNLLRVGTKEKVFIEAQDYAGNDIPVKIIVKNYPRETDELLSQMVTLTEANNFQALVDVQIPDDKNYFSEDPLEKQYVYLEAQFPTSSLKQVVMLSFHSGYIFVQTDKSIYSPGSTVYFRIFAMSPDLQPVSDSGIIVEIINNQGIPITGDVYYPKEGTVSHSYDIPEISGPGMWSIAVRYKNTPQKNFTSEFEVKEYVLPSFEVTLTPSKPFFYVDDEKLVVDISAKYLFGKKVDGHAFVVFGVKNDDTKTSLPDSLRKVSINQGEGEATLTKAMIQKTFPDIHQLVGSSLYISVSVLTKTGSEMVEAQRKGIQIVTSPYTIHFKRTAKYFKPGMTFDVTVYVTNPDETPAENVEVEISPGPVRARTKSNGIAKVVINAQPGLTLPINVKTVAQGIRDDRQATNEMTAQAYATKGSTSNYLHISIDSAELTIGDQMNLNLNFGKSQIKNQDITYLILSKGQIVKAHRFKGRSQSMITLSLPVFKDLVPSFRVVAYYHVGASEVVSDSTWVDVKDTCMGSLKVSVKNARGTYLPGDPFQLIVTGDPGAKVGLVAVDKAVFILNNNRLTQSKVWDVIEKHDTGCTAGSGKNNMGVFYDAGLMFKSDKAGETDSRTDPECPKPLKRKRRAESLLQVTQTLTGKYSDQEIRKCCSDGLKQNLMKYTCERRATYITDGEKCREAFLHCCNEMKKRENDQKQPELALARSDEDDDDYISSDEIVVRAFFPESWLRDEIQLPPCPDNTPCDKTSLTMKDNYLKDSITTWQILAISLSKTHGICVADPFNMVVVKDFFVDLKLPYSAVRNEQIEVKAVLHNYSPALQKVRVDFLETEHICSGANKKGKYRTIVKVNSMSTKTVPFVIIPMEIGEYKIEVLAASSSYQDGVKKTLKVVSEGILTEMLVKNVELNPSKEGGVQFISVRSDVPGDQVPETPAHTHITVAGQELSQTIEQAISGKFMGSLIVQPHGCGEQTMIFMTLPLIAVHYLDSTNQWDGVGVNRRTEAVQHIKTGYEREQTFRKSDGSYGAWITHASSTWLTAYVAKVFAMASDIISVKTEILCSAIKWLIMNGQLPDGIFSDNAPVIHGEMVGDVRGKDGEASLTAFVLIAMQEGNKLCADSVKILPDSMQKAINYLEQKLPTLTNPYAVAMTSYAMANAGKFNKEILMKHSSEDGAFWQVAGQHHFTLEATAYAILALVKAKDYDAAGRAVNWLNRQSSPYGGWGTTQVTIMVFQAVAEYYKQVKELQNSDLDVEVAVSGRTRLTRWVITRSNIHVTRSDKVKLMQAFNVTAKGTAAGTLKVMTLYYARPAEKQGDCEMFSLLVNMDRINDAEKEGQESYLLTIEFLYKDLMTNATMTILDIGLLTGFVVDQGDLADLANGKEKYIQKFELDKQLSERGSLIIYLDKVTNKFPEKLVFRLHKEQNVAMLQPAAVTIYEYYSPDKRCVKFYHPVKKDGALSRLCVDQEGLCQCAEENCSVQKKNNIPEKDRDLKACESGMDYVYKVRVVKMEFLQNTDLYTMKIEEVLKEGSDLGVDKQERVFIGHVNCRDFFGFVEGKTYLIMGHSKDLPRIKGRLQYILGEKTWIEYWPTREEGQTQKYRDQFNHLSTFAQTLLDFGCTT